MRPKRIEQRRPIAAIMVLFGLIPMLACGRISPAPPGKSGEPASSVILPSGRAYRVEIAATPEERVQGLMYRESLARGRGMLFLFPSSSVERFWMKNCNFPIDIVWMDGTRKVIFISRHTPPCREDPCPTYGPDAKSRYVLEIPDGAAALENIQEGSLLEFRNVSPPPPY